jgi:septum site-determining protein MinC
MSVRTSEQEAQSPLLFEIKWGSINVPILKLLSDDLEAVASSLQQKVKQAPDFFRNAPVVIDLHDLAVPDAELDFSRLVQALHECGLVPVGVRGGVESQHHAARVAALAVLADTKHESAHHAPSPKPAARPAVHIEPAIGKLIDHPIRSGQRIYAAGGDLVVLAPVSAGAEIMADGNIHVYNSLRGRALAGVQGNLNSRIFCLDLQAELVSIGGHYKISENLSDSVRGKPVQIYFRDNSLVIEDL